MYKTAKRILDIALSVVALIVLAPLLLLVMVVLKFTGERQVFYRQERMGVNGSYFRIWKFATMLKDSPKMDGGFNTKTNDPRVLPVGRFLRKTKINELPQLFNILLGEMSIVGPRPLVDKPYPPYSDEDKRIIYSVRPGLTGLGSVVFRDEERILTESPLSAEECYAKVISPYKGRLEKYYLAHFGLWTDVKLVFLTAWVVFFPNSKLVEKCFRDLPRP
jgi:lipopolysaccharide/colanic/teichoic acid biosynthesis glycosyltransferase